MLRFQVRLQLSGGGREEGGYSGNTYVAEGCISGLTFSEIQEQTTSRPTVCSFGWLQES